MRYREQIVWTLVRVILSIEFLWALSFLSFVIWFSAIRTLDLVVRDVFIKTAFHINSSLNLFNAARHFKGSPTPLLWILFTIVTDLWSVLDTYLFLVNIATGSSDLGPVLALQIVTPIAIVLSGSSAVCYGLILYWHNSGEKKEDNVEVPLLPPKKINHRIN